MWANTDFFVLRGEKMANKSFQISVDFIGNISDLQNKVRGLATDINKIGSTSIGNSI